MTFGNVNSFQSLGTLDGPAIRYVVFLQGCSFRCIYCHNPETWDTKQNILISPRDLLLKILPYKPYFGKRGGITISGGEPLLQIDFLIEIFTLCRENGITTALDTTGAIKSEKLDALFKLCDFILLDIKFSKEEQYLEYTKASLENVLSFLDMANNYKNEIILRQVVVKGYNDKKEDLEFINALKDKYKNITKIEFLPLSKLCADKYKKLSIPFPAQDL